MKNFNATSDSNRQINGIMTMQGENQKEALNMTCCLQDPNQTVRLVIGMSGHYTK
jgi:polyisoprenoid-binding protein YceI